MKKLLSVLLFIPGLSLLPSAAQDIDEEKVTFTYHRLPLEPIGKEFKNYVSKVEMNYAAEDAKKMAEWEEQKKAAEEKYEKDMAQWREDDKKAEEVYQKELTEYNKKSALKKLADKELNNEGKPYKRSPQMPYKEIPPKPEIHKAYDTDLLATTYIKLEGFTKSPDNAVVVTVTLYGFEMVGPELVTEARNVYNSSTKSTQSVNYYHYESKYKYPMSVKVEVPGRGVIYSESVEKFNEFTILKTPETDKSSSLNMSSESYRKSTEDKALAENLKYINDMVNKKFGFVPTQREIKLYTVDESKKADYSDYKRAFDASMAGYRVLGDNKTTAQEKLKAAIDEWENAMKESDPKNKKARVDEDVTVITIINLMEAYTWMDDYANAEKYLDMFNSMDGSKKQKKYVDALEEILKDQKMRYTANNK